MSPYFSIILPIYNVAPYLARCIKSVLGQSFWDYELILVNDGSTDRSPEICNSFGSRDQRIRVIHKENGGLSSARNAGFEMARGQYIWWVDSDDWITHNALEILYQASLQKNADVIKFNHIRVAQDALEHRSIVKPGFYSEKNQINEMLRTALTQTSKFGLSAWANIYRRDFLQNHQLTFTSERIVCSEDYLFNLKVLLLAERIAVIADPLYMYEQREGSLTQRYKKDLPERYTQLYTQLCEYYRDAGVLDLYEKKICRFFVWHLLRGTCFPNEYRVSKGHSVAGGRRNIRAFLKEPEIRQAMKRCDGEDFDWKQRVQLWAMQRRLEPLFYWLYVVKPNRKRRESL